jgi:hypothetical protein
VDRTQLPWPQLRFLSRYGVPISYDSRLSPTYLRFATGTGKRSCASEVSRCQLKVSYGAPSSQRPRFGTRATKLGDEEHASFSLENPS